MEERWNEERMESANAAPDATQFFRINVSPSVSHSASWEQLPDGSPDAPHSSSEGAPIRASSRKRPPYGSPIQGSLEPLHGSHFFFRLSVFHFSKEKKNTTSDRLLLLEILSFSLGARFRVRL